jgi:hypothetical protein
LRRASVRWRRTQRSARNRTAQDLQGYPPLNGRRRRCPGRRPNRLASGQTTLPGRAADDGATAWPSVRLCCSVAEPCCRPMASSSGGVSALCGGPAGGRAMSSAPASGPCCRRAATPTPAGAPARWPCSGHIPQAGPGVGGEAPAPWGARGGRGLAPSRAQPGDASALIGRKPASHGMAANPEQASHWAAAAGVRGLSQREGLHAVVLMPIALTHQEPFQLRWRFIDGGEGRLHDDLLRPARESSPQTSAGSPRDAPWSR